MRHETCPIELLSLKKTCVEGPSPLSAQSKIANDKVGDACVKEEAYQAFLQVEQSNV